MNKKLGALALVGASAVVLAGCAGGSGGTPERGGDRRDHASGSSAPTRPTRRATTSSRRSRTRTRAGPSRSRRRPGPTRARPTSPRCRPTTRPTSSRSATRRHSASSTRVCSLDITDIQEDLGGDDLLPGLVDAGTYEGAFYAAPYYAGGRIVFYTPADRRRRRCPTTLDEYVAKGIAHDRPTPSRASTRRARTGTTPFPTSGLARRRDRRDSTPCARACSRARLRRS